MTTALTIAAALAYAGVAVHLWRRWAWEIAHTWLHTRGEAVAFGFLQAVVWPVVLAVKAARSDSFLLPPADVRQREREQALEARIRDLERQVGLDPEHDGP